MSMSYTVDRMLLNSTRNERYNTEPGFRLFYCLISGVYSAVMEDPDENDLTFCDIDAEHVLPVFPDSSRSCVEVWNDELKKGVLSCIHFKEHWRIWVPEIYSPEPNTSSLDWSFDEAKAREVLFDTLEQFICNGDPQEVLTKLSQLDSPPSVCGRVFKMGEPTYSCRECGMDPTCVLCVDCFKQSAHRHHKYKMGKYAD